MSYVATTWAWKQDFQNPLRKMIMLYIADCANPDNDWRTWHAFRTISKACGCSVGSVSTHMAYLVESGYLTLLRQGTRKGETNMYRLNVGQVTIEIGPSLDRSAAEQSDVDRSSPVGHCSSPEGDRSAVGGDRSAPVDKPVIQPVIKTVSEPVKTDTRKRDEYLPPDWIPIDSWSAYLKSRREKKHPMNQHSLRLCVKSIKACVDEGVPVDVILDHLIEAGWRSVKTGWLDGYRQQGAGGRKSTPETPSQRGARMARERNARSPQSTATTMEVISEQ